MLYGADVLFFRIWICRLQDKRRPSQCIAVQQSGHHQRKEMPVCFPDGHSSPCSFLIFLFLFFPVCILLTLKPRSISVCPITRFVQAHFPLLKIAACIAGNLPRTTDRTRVEQLVYDLGGPWVDIDYSMPLSPELHQSFHLQLPSLCNLWFCFFFPCNLSSESGSGFAFAYYIELEQAELAVRRGQGRFMDVCRAACSFLSAWLFWHPFAYLLCFELQGYPLNIQLALRPNSSGSSLPRRDREKSHSISSSSYYHASSATSFPSLSSANASLLPLYIPASASSGTSLGPGYPFGGSSVLDNCSRPAMPLASVPVSLSVPPAASNVGSITAESPSAYLQVQPFLTGR